MAFGSAYLLAAMVGHWLRTAHGDFPGWWPSGGLLLATLLARERQEWPRFAAIALTMEVASGIWLYRMSIPAGLTAGLMQIIGVFACCHLVLRWRGAPFRLQSLRDALTLTFAALLGAMIGATSSASVIAPAEFQAFSERWLQGWLGNTAGILIVTPLVLALLNHWHPLHNFRALKWTEAAALLLSLIAAGHIAFGGYLPLAAILMPLLLWAGLRFGLPAGVAAAAVLWVIALRHTAIWQGPLSSPALDASTRALWVQSSLCVAGACTIALMAWFNQRQAAQHALQQVLRREHDSLEARVEERTAVQNAASESLRNLSARRDTLLEAERARLAREIHDDLGATITGVTLHIQMALSAGGNDLPLVRERLEQALQLVDAANQSMHRIINDLHPSVLDLLGIWGALEWLANQWQARTGLPCEIAVDPALSQCTMNGERATAVFRIVQESLTNVTRHAEATRVDIIAQLAGDSVAITIQDDGKGISHDGTARPGSMGLLGMQERARRFGGTLRITGNSEPGTQVMLRLPLQD